MNWNEATEWAKTLSDTQLMAVINELRVNRNYAVSLYSAAEIHDMFEAEFEISPESWMPENKDLVEEIMGEAARQLFQSALRTKIEYLQPVNEDDLWKECALKHGWAEIEADDSGLPALYHAELDRIWPALDYRGACLDIDVSPYED